VISSMPAASGYGPADRILKTVSRWDPQAGFFVRCAVYVTDEGNKIWDPKLGRYEMYREQEGD
jgi:hypothetical protein